MPAKSEVERAAIPPGFRLSGEMHCTGYTLVAGPCLPVKSKIQVLLKDLKPVFFPVFRRCALHSMMEGPAEMIGACKAAAFSDFRNVVVVFTQQFYSLGQAKV